MTPSASAPRSRGSSSSWNNTISQKKNGRSTSSPRPSPPFRMEEREIGARRFAILARSVAGLPLLLRGGEGWGEEALFSTTNRATQARTIPATEAAVMHLLSPALSSIPNGGEGDGGATFRDPRTVRSRTPSPPLRRRGCPKGGRGGAHRRSHRLSLGNGITSPHGRTRREGGFRPGWASVLAVVAGHGLALVFNVELHIDVVQVGAHGFHADVELVGNFLVGITLGDEFDDLALAR